jgi:parvulin-like peptidyl-prolyl isomerase
MLWISLGVAAWLAGLAGCDRAPAVGPALSGDPNEVFATVNGEKITREEVELRLGQWDTMDPKAAAQKTEQQRRADLRSTVDQLIEERIMLQEAAKAGIQVSDEEAGQGLAQLRRRFGSDEALDAFLKKGKTSIALRMVSDREALTRAKLEEKHWTAIQVSDADIEGYWQRSKPFLVRDLARVGHILVETESEAQEKEQVGARRGVRGLGQAAFARYPLQNTRR